MLKTITFFLMLMTLLFILSCDDPYTGDSPVGALIVMMDTVDSDAMESLTFVTREVEALVEIDAEDGAGFHVTTDTASRTLVIPGEEGTYVLAQYEVPAGYVTQLRIYPENISIIYNGEEHPVTLPSGENTGWKIVPVDDEPFYVPANGKVIIRGTFDERLRIIKTGNGQFKLRPTIEMYPVEEEDALGVENDVVLLRVNPGVTTADIEAACSVVDVVLEKSFSRYNIHKLRLPPHLPLNDALDYFNSLPITYVASFSAYEFAHVVPNDGIQQHQNTVNMDPAWDKVTGDYRIVVANADSGVQLDHPDIYMNIWINEGEIPAAFTFVDADADGIISFFDLNDGANAGVVADANGNGFIDGRDLLDNSSGFEDGVDNDNNGFTDDLVGWDFIGNDNDPHSSTGNGGHWHGTATSGVTAAMTDNNTGVSGTSWTARIMVVRVLNNNNSGTDTVIIDGMLYADQMQADILNMSLGSTWQRKKKDHSNISRFDMPSDDWNDYLADRVQLFNFTATMAPMIFVSSGNETVNLDDGDTFGGICEALDRAAGIPQVTIVGATTADGTARAGFSCHGSLVSVYSPGESWTLLHNGGATTIADGTSFSCPQVSGVAALLMARNNLALQGNHQTVYDRITGRGVVMGYGTLLDADAATDP